MSVVIHEFEVVAEPPERPREAPAASAAPTGPTAHDIAVVIRHEAERLERVRAH